MTTISREAVLEALKTITEPVTGKDLASSDMLRALNIDHGKVSLVLEINPAHASKLEPMRLQTEEKIRALPGVKTVHALMTGESEPPKAPQARSQHPAANRQRVPGVKKLIAVASGKGGVGKSTVTTNLAFAFHAMGFKMGLLDADVYGPSQPRMLGVSKKPSSPDGKMIIPPVSNGITMMSMGLMLNEDQAVVWRGPMLMGALQQMLMQVQWGNLDILLVDMPPGTGDVALTLAQKAELDGAIIVSTPQDIALLDARKGINMFKKLETPIFGMIENMSTYICSNCGHEEHIFGHGGVAQEARKLGVPLLAEIPLNLAIRLGADEGQPIVLEQPESPPSKAFFKAAQALVDQGVVLKDNIAS